PPAYEELNRSPNLNFVPRGAATGEQLYNRPPSSNIYNYPTVQLNAGMSTVTESGSSTAVNPEACDDEDEADASTLITDFYGTRPKSQSSSSCTATSSHNSRKNANRNPSPPATFTTTLSSDMMDPSSGSGIFRKSTANYN